MKTTKTNKAKDSGKEKLYKLPNGDSERLERACYAFNK
jgi:hypothetical protein